MITDAETAGGMAAAVREVWGCIAWRLRGNEEGRDGEGEGVVDLETACEMEEVVHRLLEGG